MVGVPGKSKGCYTCRQRKIKCGQQKPQCLQCARSRRRCPGYQRALVFVQVNPSAKGDLDLTKPWSLLQTGYRQHFLDEFHTHLVPQTAPFAGTESWLTQLLQLPIQTQALEYSGMALCTAIVSRTQDDSALLQESLRLYTRGLRELQTALYTPALVRHDETLAACLTLAMYEIAECPARHVAGYYQHCRGLLSLLQARGVDAHTSGLGHQLFLAVRVQGIFYDLGQLEPSFMAQAEWIEKPWQKFAKKLIDRIIDCVAHIPRLFHQLHLFEHLSPEDQRLRGLRLMAEFQSLDTTLQNIYSILNDSVEGPLYWSALSRHYDPAGDLMKGPLFPVAFHFPNFKTAGHLMMYWATCALLWTGWREIYENLEQLNENPSPHVPPCDVLPMITNVCQSAEFCLDETNQLMGASIASTPLAICKGILSNKASHQQHFAWIQVTLERLQTRELRILKYH